MFKYIFEDSNGITTYDKYFEYIESVKNELSEEMYKLFSDVDRYNLTSVKSLHDSWLRTIQVNDILNNEDEVEKIETSISIELLGPYHDRVFSLQYSGVKSYVFNKPARNIPIYHYDLLCHELRLNDKSSLEHMILFDNEISFLIEFSNFSFDEKILAL